MSRPPLLDLDYTAACEAAAKVLHRHYDSEYEIAPWELLSADQRDLFMAPAAELVDAVWPILHAAAQPPACGDYSTHWGCHCTRTGEHDQHGCRCGTTWKGDGK